MRDFAVALGLRDPLPIQEIAAALASGFGLDRIPMPEPRGSPDQPQVFLRRSGSASPDANPPGACVSARWLIAGDVRLDRRADLAHSLGLDSPTAAAMTEIELVACAFDRWNDDAFVRLLGGFALAAWDRSRQRLYLATDPSCEKFVHFHFTPRGLLAASRAPILLATPAVPRTVDLHGLLHFYGSLPGQWRTSLAGIEAVPPGHAAVIDVAGRYERRRWWSPPAPSAWIGRSIDRPITRFRSVFRGAVADRLPPDGKLGGFCSGGLDSTAVTAVACDQLARQGRTYHSFTAVPHPDWRQQAPSALVDDESAYVRQLAERHANLFPTFVALDGTIFLDCLPIIFERSAGPHRNASNLAWILAIETLLKAERIHRPLGGWMGNFGISLQCDIVGDLFATGRLDLAAAELRADPPAFWAAVRRALASTWQTATSGRPNHASGRHEWPWRHFVTLRPDAPQAHDLRSEDYVRDAFVTGFSARKALMNVIRESTGALNGFDPALEHLDPTADRRVLELCWSLPPTEFRHGNTDRRLIRRAMHGVVPDGIRLRRALGAQAPDAGLHLGRRLADLRAAVEFIADDSLCAGLIDIPELRRWLDEWPADDRSPGSRAVGAHLRAVAMGLYIRWINEGLTSLPGARAIRAPIVAGPRS